MTDETEKERVRRALRGAPENSPGASGAGLAFLNDEEWQKTLAACKDRGAGAPFQILYEMGRRHLTPNEIVPPRGQARDDLLRATAEQVLDSLADLHWIRADAREVWRTLVELAEEKAKG